MNVAQPNHLRRFVTIWIVGSILGVLFAIFGLPHLLDLPPSASGRADEINLTMVVFTALSAPVFVGVITFALYSVITFNNHGRPAVDGPPIYANRRVQVMWLASSVVLGLFLLGWGLYYLYQIDLPPQGNVLYVDVVGEQWAWNYTYPQYQNPSGKQGFGAQSSVLMLPVNRPVEFTITSVDVTHSFWVPAFAIKEDAVPGEWNKTTVTPSQLGTYSIRCMELCGLYHAYMEQQAKVVTSTAFDSWVNAQGTGQYPLTYPSSGFTAPPASPIAYSDVADVRRFSF